MSKIPTGRFVWFEIVTPEPSKAQGFYGELFGWKAQAMPMPGMDYSVILHGDKRIGGFLKTPTGAPPHAHWLSHLQVTDAAASSKQITAAGGKVLKEPTKMGDFGTMAIAADNFGAAFALWQPSAAEGTGDYLGVPGAFCWNELTSPDPAKSVAFYSKLGGFTEEKMEMGPSTYHVLNSEGKGRAGISKPMMEGVPTAWTPYVHVANADDITARAKRLGATVHVGPMDIPTVGRFSIFTEANSGTIGILQPLPQDK